MSKTQTLGGERLGSGKKMKVTMNNYERSNHNLSFVWRSTMAAGTLVPFLSKVMLPGDTFDIDLEVDVKTHPTVGPLFGNYKVQLDVYKIPFRLYQAQLHNNKIGIGMNMSAIKLPLVFLQGNAPNAANGPIDNQQMNPSSIFSYLGIRGLGKNEAGVTPAGRWVQRAFNAIPWIAYWDIYKNYYSNKQEGIGAVLHTEVTALPQVISTVSYTNPPAGSVSMPAGTAGNFPIESDITVVFTCTATPPANNQIVMNLSRESPILLTDAFNTIVRGATTITCTNPKLFRGGPFTGWNYASAVTPIDSAPSVVTFPLTGIDGLRENILTNVANTNSYNITFNTVYPPFHYALQKVDAADNLSTQTSKMYSQEGLGLKTYQSDLFQNWLSATYAGTGPGSVSALTAVSTAGGSFTIDSLILAEHVYNVLNRVMVSGGTYYDWIDAVWSHDRVRNIESPMYVGGLISELGFQEVISNAAAIDGDAEQPLGTLAGKGAMGNKNKGGRVIVKADEPQYVMGIISLTPRVDYSQGNDWDVNLLDMDDLHKPGMDQIGFQQLITDQMAYWETENNSTGTVQTYQSAGFQPAWINYMTSVNKSLGNFADPNNEMFMTLNRRYEFNSATGRIRDLTTYIDPVKFNYIFAQTSRDAQNFWVQIGVGIRARRKMSAKLMPNL